jgi:ADP-ribose pyrophosphatase YjhB (NUDIX family)
MKGEFPFNVRAYGALILHGHILLSSENYRDIHFTKLPGGALEFGESLPQCVEREYLEEAGLKVEVLSHLYTTDFFQKSAFNESHQVISIYFHVKLLGEPDTLPKVVSLENKGQVFSWKNLEMLTVDDFTFPIDKHIVPLLKRLGR